VFVSTSGLNAAPAGKHILVLRWQHAGVLMLLCSCSVWHIRFCTTVHALVFAMRAFAWPVAS
jgi:hypothetical protein